MELCGVPAKEHLRKNCLEVLTELTAPTPSTAWHLFPDSQEPAQGLSARVLLAKLINGGLSQSAAQRLHMFLSSEVCLLPTNLEDAVDALLRAVGDIRHLDSGSNADPRRLKRYNDIGRSAKHLKHLSQVLGTVGVSSHLRGHYAEFSLMAPTTILLNNMMCRWRILLPRFWRQKTIQTITQVNHHAGESNNDGDGGFMCFAQHPELCPAPTSGYLINIGSFDHVYVLLCANAHSFIFSSRATSPVLILCRNKMLFTFCPVHGIPTFDKRHTPFMSSPLPPPNLIVSSVIVEENA